MGLSCGSERGEAKPIFSAIRRSLRRARTVGMVAFAFGAGLVIRTATAAPCGSGLPPSKLLVYDMKPVKAQRVAVPAQAIRQMAARKKIPSVHPAMLIAREITGVFQIEHRVVEAENGRIFCDIPPLVRIGLGYSQETIYVAAEAAVDPCVQDTLLAHAAVHDRVNSEALDTFLDDQNGFLSTAMAALKRTLAPSAEAVVEQWQAGVAAIVQEMRQRLEALWKPTQAKADEPIELARMENACDGKLKRLESQLGNTL